MTSHDFEKLQYLLSKFDDIQAKDYEGRSIFDHVDNLLDLHVGSYHRDLWYCALKRAGIDVSRLVANQCSTPAYTKEYTPEHHHALKHLQSWDEDNFRSQMDRLLQEIPLDEDGVLEMERLRLSKARKKGEGDWYLETFT